MTPLFIATERFDPSDGQAWNRYVESPRVKHPSGIILVRWVVVTRVTRAIDAAWHFSVTLALHFPAFLIHCLALYSGKGCKTRPIFDIGDEHGH